MNIDFDAMGEYFNKSSRTLRRWEKERPEKFNIMLEEYLRESASTNNNENKGCIIGAFSIKGGVGKSTICDALGSFLDESVILNLDIGQRASEINACPTIDYSDIMNSGKTIEMILNELSLKYRYIIVDTPGEITEEVVAVIPFIKHFIIPMTIGKRSRYGIESTIEGFFNNEDLSIDGNIKVMFLINAYKNLKKRDAAIVHFKTMYSQFKPANDIKLISKLSALDYSDAISSAEEAGESIVTLAQQNPGAYTKAMRKINAVCRTIEQHFEL